VFISRSKTIEFFSSRRFVIFIYYFVYVRFSHSPSPPQHSSDDTITETTLLVPKVYYAVVAAASVYNNNVAEHSIFH